jgi:hypothetical protein
MAVPPDKRDPRDVFNYTFAEAARWLGVKPNTLRTWLLGQRTRGADFGAP